MLTPRRRTRARGIALVTQLHHATHARPRVLCTPPAPRAHARSPVATPLGRQRDSHGDCTATTSDNQHKTPNPMSPCSSSSAIRCIRSPGFRPKDPSGSCTARPIAAS